MSIYIYIHIHIYIYIYMYVDDFRTCGTPKAPLVSSPKMRRVGWCLMSSLTIRGVYHHFAWQHQWAQGSWTEVMRTWWFHGDFMVQCPRLGRRDEHVEQAANIGRSWGSNSWGWSDPPGSISLVGRAEIFSSLELFQRTTG